MENEVAAALAAKYGTPVTVASGTAAFAFGYDANTIGMLIGVFIGFAGLIVTWHYKREDNKRKIHAEKIDGEERALRVELLKKQLNESSNH